MTDIKNGTAADGAQQRNKKNQRTRLPLGGTNRLRCPVCRIGLAVPQGNELVCQSCNTAFKL